MSTLPYGMRIEIAKVWAVPLAQGDDSDGDRQHQTTRSRQRLRVHSRRRRPGVVLSPQFGPGELRSAERRTAGSVRRRAVGEGTARRQRTRRRLSTAAPALILFDIDGTLVLT